MKILIYHENEIMKRKDVFCGHCLYSNTTDTPLFLHTGEANSANFIQTWQKHTQVFVRSSFQISDQPGTLKCSRSQCKTCPFSHNEEKKLRPKRYDKDHWSLHVHLRQCHLLHNLHLLQKVIHWWNKKTTKWPKTPSRRRKKWQGRIQISQ